MRSNRPSGYGYKRHALVADALGYSHHVAFLHAEKSAEPWARYAARHAGDQR